MVAWKRQLILFGGFHESARLVLAAGAPVLWSSVEDRRSPPCTSEIRPAPSSSALMGYPSNPVLPWPLL